MTWLTYVAGEKVVCPGYFKPKRAVRHLRCRHVHGVVSVGSLVRVRAHAFREHAADPPSHVGHCRSCRMYIEFKHEAVASELKAAS